jgi:hypothetical protein
MNTKEELTGLFTTYFGDKISPAQIEDLAAGVVAAQADRRTRLPALSCATRLATPACRPPAQAIYASA